MCFKISFILLLMGSAIECVELVKVKVEQGWLVGQVLTLPTGKGQYNSFKGIPYAKPPVGKLRFRDPQPPLNWKGERNALEHGPICVQQVSLTNRSSTGKEDCLFLNVYTSSLKPDSPMPVMLFIHGGGFVTGSGNDNEYSPDFIVSYGVVLVTINYRLGALGFLNVGTKEVPGNAGMKDQVAAMQWVQRNIAVFGGNPNSVTIFGQSAGGASVTLHLVSPAAKGLFQRGIAMSGVSFNDWAQSYDPERRAFALGRALGMDTYDRNKLINYLQNLPAYTINEASPNIAYSDNISIDLMNFNYFTPSVEKKFGNGDGQYLTERADILMCRGQINQADLFIGHTAKEGLRVTTLIENYIPYYNVYKQFLVPRKITHNRNFETILEVADRIQMYFFGNKSIGKEAIRNFVNFSTYLIYVYDIHAYAEKFPKKPCTNAKLFFYTFEIYSTRNVFSKPGAIRYGIKEATHRDDLPYLFNGKVYNLTLNVNSEAYKYVQLTCKLFTNFAKYGTPTPDSSLGLNWPEYSPNRSAVVIGRSGNLTARTVYFTPNTNVGFFKQLYLSTGMNY